MRIWKRSLCLLLLVALLLGLCPGVNAAADGSDIIFLALNDAMPYGLSSETMPYWSGGQLYVHSSTFDITSINLSASYNASNMTLLLYSGTGRRSLTFYLSEGYVQTQSGATEEITAAMRGDQVFLPLDYCAAFFGLNVSYLTSLKGWPLVRLTTGAQVWEDAFFVEQADKLINDRAEKYMDSFRQPVVAPEPDVPNIPDSVAPPAPDDIQRPEPEDPEEQEQRPLTVYLALVGVEAACSAMELLTEHDIRAAVYLNAEEIQSEGDLVRQLYGAGHSIGVVGDLETANKALEVALCRRSMLTLDQTDASCFSHYSTHSGDNLEDAEGETPILLRLEGEQAGEILLQLLARNVTLLQLRETTQMFLQETETVEETAGPPVL